MRRALDLAHAAIKSRAFYPVVFLGCLVPGVVLGVQFYRAATGIEPEALGANPVEALLHTTGQYALGTLLITLAVTPIRRLTGWNQIQKVRRMLGVWSFAYAVMHLSTYLIFNQNCYSVDGCQFEAIWIDLMERKFIFVGMLAFTILLLLAITSTNGWMRRLKRRWLLLHRLVYVAAVAGVVHFAWGQKADISEPLRWAAALAVLFGVRVYFLVLNRSARARAARPRQSS